MRYPYPVDSFNNSLIGKSFIYYLILSLRYITLLIKSLHSAVCVEKLCSMNQKIILCDYK